MVKHNLLELKSGMCCLVLHFFIIQGKMKYIIVCMDRFLNCIFFVYFAFLSVYLWLQGVHPCDKRRSISDYQFLFPAIDFSLASTKISMIYLRDSCYGFI